MSVEEEEDFFFFFKFIFLASFFTCFNMIVVAVSWVVQASTTSTHARTKAMSAKVPFTGVLPEPVVVARAV